MSIVIEGPAGSGKSFLARKILDALAPGAATVVVLAGEEGRRHDPFAAAGPPALPYGWLPGRPPGVRPARGAGPVMTGTSGPMVRCRTQPSHTPTP